MSVPYKNMRMALDAVSDTHPIVLWSSHSAAFNSTAFAQARDLEGKVVGMNRETLPTVYADYREMVSVDETGEPTGKVVEEARSFVRDTVFEDLMGLNESADYAMPAVAEILAQSGITSIQDPMSVARTLELYDWFEKSGEPRRAFTFTSTRNPIWRRTRLPTPSRPIRKWRTSWA